MRLEIVWSRWGPHGSGRETHCRVAMKDHLHARRQLIHANLHTLRGHDLACWCKAGTPCHADVLLEIANQ